MELFSSHPPEPPYTFPHCGIVVEGIASPEFSLILERLRIPFTANGKRQTWISVYHVTKFSIYLSFTVHYNYTKISRFKPILSITIVSSCFYAPTSHFENFPTWISRLTFAVDAMLNLSINFLPRSQAGVGRWKILEAMWSFIIMRVCGFFYKECVFGSPQTLWWKGLP